MLLPCPHCGVDPWSSETFREIACRNSGCEIGFAKAATWELTIEKWNTRVASTSGVPRLGLTSLGNVAAAMDSQQNAHAALALTLAPGLGIPSDILYKLIALAPVRCCFVWFGYDAWREFIKESPVVYDFIGVFPPNMQYTHLGRFQNLGLDVVSPLYFSARFARDIALLDYRYNIQAYYSIP